MRITMLLLKGKLNVYAGFLILAILGWTWTGTKAFSVRAYDGSMEDEGDTDTYNPELSPGDQYVTLLKRYYGGWGHGRRFPWKRLPHQMCFREPCKYNRECCYRWNICDKSAKVCVDCWYGSACRSEKDCCSRYPYCARVWKKSKDGSRYIAAGKCVRKL